MPNLLASIHPFRVSGSRSLLTCRSEQQILCLLQGTLNNNYVGRYNFITFRIMSNPVGKTTKTSSKQVILQMHFICFSFQDMRSVKIWRDEFKAAENLLFTQAVVKNDFVFWNCSEVRYSITYRHSGYLKISCEYSMCTSEPAL